MREIQMTVPRSRVTTRGERETMAWERVTARGDQVSVPRPGDRAGAAIGVV